MQNESTNHPSRTICFRADWLLEACSGYEEVTWQEIGKWARSDRLWTDDKGNPYQQNPIDVNYRWRVLNPSLKLLESLGHLDVIWQEYVITTPISWVRTCWEEIGGNEWLLCGVRCDDFVDDLASNQSLKKEDLVISGIKDKQIIDVLKEHRCKLQIKLPDRITFTGEGVPQLPENAKKCGSIEYPYSWELCKSLTGASDLEQKVVANSQKTNITENTLRKMRFLQPEKNRFIRAGNLTGFFNYDLCLSEKYLGKQGYSSVNEAIRLIDSNSGILTISKYELNSEEKLWLSYFLLSKDIRTLQYDSNENSILHPITLELPTVIRRLLTLCSGRPPKVVFINNQPFVMYSHVGCLIALEVAEIMNVDLICK